MTFVTILGLEGTFRCPMQYFFHKSSAKHSSQKITSAMLYLDSSKTHLLSLLSFLIVSEVVGHGFLKSPRSRNWVAQEDGVNTPGPQSSGKPEQDFCYHCLNSKATHELCSYGNAATSYDSWNDINGDPMPWISQAVYDEGDEITVEAVLTCLLYTSPRPRDRQQARMPSSA